MPDLITFPILAEATSTAARLSGWLHDGGFFLWLILGCAGISLFVIILRCGWMRHSQMMAPALVSELEKLENDPGALDRIRVLVRGRDGQSALGKVSHVAMQGVANDLPDLEGAVEARARREITRQQWGLAMLEVIITIAPLLGLLGTAAGLVDVFGGIAGEQKDVARIAMGVGKALSTTIAGLAVAVPSVIAHSTFSTAIEHAAVEMEVLMHRLVSRLVRDAKSE